MTAMMVDAPAADQVAAKAGAAVSHIDPSPMSTVAALPVPLVEQTPPTADICALPEVGEALAAGDDEGVILAAGGGEAFRSAVVAGNAPCVSLSDPGAGMGRDQQDPRVRSHRLASGRPRPGRRRAQCRGRVRSGRMRHPPSPRWSPRRRRPASARSRWRAASARSRRSSRRTATRSRVAASRTPTW